MIDVGIWDTASSIETPVHNIGTVLRFDERFTEENRLTWINIDNLYILYQSNGLS